MERTQSRIFFLTLFALVVLSAGATYYRYIVLEHFDVITEEGIVPHNSNQ